ncbi:LLM class F420-dependent oxidoreductase [Blastococcus sp. SYSU D00669]
MRIGMQIGSRSLELLDAAADLESAGLQIAFVPELYGFDAVSRLGYLAARTTALEIASGILQLYTRTPTLTAMTAAGLDQLSRGRFTLGVGASGPQVIEGFHGVRYDAPVGRTRELVEICRSVWARERLVHHGQHYDVPLPAGQGTGLGKPLKLVDHPVRERIPVMLAAIGPKNVELAAEIAEGWQPILFHPDRAAEVFGPALDRGLGRRDPALGPLDVALQTAVAIGADVARERQVVREELALYVGGMGARGKNFYNDLAARYGYAEEAARVQELYLAGRKEEAAAAVPEGLVDATSLVGTAEEVAERLAALHRAGVTTLIAKPLAADVPGTLRIIEQLRLMAS